jgi:hypothetical protein
MLSGKGIGMTARKKKLIILVAALVVALVALFLLLFFLHVVPQEAPLQDLAGESMSTDDFENRDPSDSEDEVVVDSSIGFESEKAPPSILDLEGVIPASGAFELHSVQLDTDLILIEVTDEYATVIEALRSVDQDFDPEGYRVRAHDSSGGRGNGSVFVTLYIGDIKTSSIYLVNVDDGNIEYVSIRSVNKPDDATRQRILQLRSDFESSSAGKAAIERTKTAMWPANSTATPDEYSEEYYFDFAEDRLYLIITDDRRQDGVIVDKQEKIDVQAVLGR